MKAAKRVKIVALTLVSIIFMGCPSTLPPNPDTDMYAYIYSPVDSVYIRYYCMPDGNRQKHEQVLGPSAQIVSVEWYSGSSKIYGEEYTPEYNDVHVRKMAGNGAAYVLRSSGVVLNGEMVAWGHFPSKYYLQENNTSFPFIEQVIDTLLVHSPETVICVNDMQEHSIYNDRILSTPPTITIK